jgi:hypothetical protein
MVAPEVSALRPDGIISYLWSCDRCGQSLVTNAISFDALPARRPKRKAQPKRGFDV